MADGGWAEDIDMGRQEIETHLATTNSSTMSMPLTLASQDSSPTALFSFERLQSRLRLISNIMTLSEHVFNNSDPETIERNSTMSRSSPRYNDSLLSGLAFFRNLTPNPALNRFVTDVLEGQIITLSVVVAFILVFLIREWVVQQRPNPQVAEVAGLLPQPEQPAAGVLDLPAELDGTDAGSTADLQESTVDTELVSNNFANDLDQDDQLDAVMVSSSSNESWQHGDGDANPERNTADARILLDPQELGDTRLTSSTSSEATPDTPTARDRADDVDRPRRVHEPETDETMHSIFAPSSEEREALAAAAVATPTPDENQNGLREVAGVQVHPQVQLSYFDIFLDWLYADVNVDGPALEEDGDMLLAQGADRVNLHGPNIEARGELEHRDANLMMPAGDVAGELVEQNENNVLDNMDAVEEDLDDEMEGLLELIGMQGPLAGLFQNAVFCAILISTTVIAAVWFPYLWGKIVLLFLAHPFQFAIKMPLILITWTCNVIVDAGLYFGCALLSQVDWLGRLALVPAGWIFVSLAGLSEYNAVSAAVQSVGNSALDRLYGLLMASMELPSSDFYHLSVSSHAALETLRIDSRAVLSYCCNVLEQFPMKVVSFGESQTAASAISGSILQVWQLLRSLPHNLALYIATSGSSQIPDTTTAPALLADEDNNLVAFVKWSAMDRFTAVSAGYMFFAVLGMLYVRAGPPLTSSEQIRKVEVIVSEVLRQAGGVLKVILIISIEMLLFPLYCGFLLDIAVLPLFDATVMARVQYTLISPWSACFLHWFIGTCYMFHFALFVSMCRKLLRGGVLYFIRDPDDPTFHPVRDVLERNIATQLRKIGFSALVYGLLVICCLGSVVWTTSYVAKGLFPIQWTSSVPRLEFPIDLMLYHTLTPIAIRLLKPAAILEKLYSWWFHKCGHALHLSHFLFGIESDSMDKSGRWVRAPSSDQVRIPKGRSVFLVVDKDNNRLDGQPDAEDDKGPHGRANEHFAKVFVPLWFRARISLFVLCIWALTAASGLAITVVPLLFGRRVLGRLVGIDQEINDIHAFSIGVTSMASAAFAIQSRVYVTEYLRSARVSYSQAMSSITRQTITGLQRTAAVVYTYSALTLLIPTIFALLLELYLIMPLHTYVQLRQRAHGPGSVLQSNITNTTLYNHSEISQTFVQYTNDSLQTLPTLPEPTRNEAVSSYTVHALQSWILGLLYTRILIRLLLTRYPNARPTRALQAVVAKGWLKPDARIATKCFILPLTVLGAMAIIAPAGLGLCINIALSHYEVDENEVASPSFLIYLLNAVISHARTLSAEEITRLGYPAVAMLGLGIVGIFALFSAVGRWRRSIRDEVYLVGEQLHNYREARPPQAPVGKVDKGKGRAVDDVLDGPDDMRTTVDAIVGDEAEFANLARTDAQ